MAVRLRLRREGAKKQAHFRVVAADAGAPRDGRFIELLGEYHPRENPSVIDVDAERALYWLRSGARPTDAVQQLLYITGVWEQFRPGTTPDRVRIQQPAEETEVGEADEKEQTEATEATAADTDAADTTDAETDETDTPAPEAEAEQPAAADEAQPADDDTEETA